MNVRVHDTELDETRSYWGITDFQVEDDQVRMMVPPDANCGKDEIVVTGSVNSAQSQTTLDNRSLDESIQYDTQTRLTIIIESPTYPRLSQYTGIADNEP